MAEVAWIKVVTDLFENRKIRQIEKLPQGDTLLVIWFKLMCLAGIVNDCGTVYLTVEVPYTVEMLATQLGRPVEVVQLALDAFQRFEMIELGELGYITLLGWEKYQNVAQLEKIRAQTRNRVAAFRERRKTGAGDATPDTKAIESMTKAPPKKKPAMGEGKRFLPPTLPEVEKYCLERKNGVSPQRFIDYYASNGWKVGRNPMKDWKAAVRNWERGESPERGGKKSGLSFEGREVDEHDIGC